jgi:branched-subunit amino acid transport protein
MTETSYLLLVVGMGIVTFLPRWVPLMVISRKNLPRLMTEWLDLIPAAILSALLAPELITSGQPRALDIAQPDFWVALPTFWIAIKTRSLALTVLMGMFLYWAAQRWL